MSRSSLIFKSAALALFASLSACGGGGSNANDEVTPPPGSVWESTSNALQSGLFALWASSFEGAGYVQRFRTGAQIGITPQPLTADALIAGPGLSIPAGLFDVYPLQPYFLADSAIVKGRDTLVSLSAGGPLTSHGGAQVRVVGEQVVVEYLAGDPLVVVQTYAITGLTLIPLAGKLKDAPGAVSLLGPYLFDSSNDPKFDPEALFLSGAAYYTFELKQRGNAVQVWFCGPVLADGPRALSCGSVPSLQSVFPLAFQFSEAYDPALWQWTDGAVESIQGRAVWVHQTSRLSDGRYYGVFLDSGNAYVGFVSRDGEAVRVSTYLNQRAAESLQAAVKP